MGGSSTCLGPSGRSGGGGSGMLASRQWRDLDSLPAHHLPAAGELAYRQGTQNTLIGVSDLVSWGYITLRCAACISAACASSATPVVPHTPAKPPMSQAVHVTAVHVT